VGDRISSEGRNCWRRPVADRVAFLVDAAQYYDAFASAVERAQRDVWILAWDVHSETPLRAGDPPLALGDFLLRVLERSPELHVHLLSWSFIALYAADREPREDGIARLQHPRLHLHFDACHPPLACHHQKIVVVDDAVAFAGGLDLTAGRWDTAAHRPDQPLRTNAKGEIGPPFHDLMMAVSGDAAAALGELCRERWYRATGERVRAPERGDSRVWPPQLAAELEGVPVAIARTEPDVGAGEVREVEALDHDAIRAAKRWIYLETQYLSAEGIGRALARRLAERNGPQVVVVMPRDSTDWLEAATMGVMRARVLSRMRRADRYKRLRVYYPTVPDIGDGYVKVHSKLVLVDDTFVRIGSSNLSGRSLGQDTECDLAIEAEGDSRVRRAINGFLARLLGEHLGCPPARFAATLERRGSLIAAIDEHRRGERTLLPLPARQRRWLKRVAPGAAVLDPPRPLPSLTRWMKTLLSADPRGSARVSALSIVSCVGVVALIAAWHVTAAEHWTDPRHLGRLAASLRDDPAAPLWVTAGYVAGSILMLPVNVMIVATALAFPPLRGFFYSLLGSVVSGVATYGVGRALGRGAVERFGGTRIRRWNRDIARHGVLAVAALRLVPVAPYAIVNLMAGASSIGLREFTVGTALGMAPGIVALTLFGRQLGDVIARPQAWSLGWLGAVTIGLGVAAIGLRRLTRRWAKWEEWEGARAAR